MAFKIYFIIVILMVTLILIFNLYLNHLLSKFATFKPNRRAFACDALALNWSEKNYYIFPSFPLIGLDLQKLEEHEADAHLIGPM